MKYIKYSIMISVLLVNVYSCGMSVDTDIDDAANTLAKIASDTMGDTSTDSGTNEAGVVDATGTEKAPYDGTNSTDSTTGGGITVVEPIGYDPSQSSYFMGTYSVGTKTGNYYSDFWERCNAKYNFPSVIRGYSHYSDNFIDFESNDGTLVWVAETFSDGTFDFSVRFLDEFGRPSKNLNFTCRTIKGYAPNRADELHCMASGDDTCPLYYIKL